MARGRIKCIDSLRGLACLIVLVAHIISTNPTFGIYASGCGKIGVWCFMVLSGFLTFLPYASGRKAITEGKTKFILNYYEKKLVKLYPVYLIALILALVIGFVEIDSVFKHLVLLEGVGHFWYMPVIIKFYILVPLLIFALEKLRNKWFVIMVTLLSSVFSIIFPFTTYVENSINLYWYLPVFLIGCALAFVYAKLDHVHSKIFDITLIVSVLGIILLTPIMREILFGMEPSGWLQNKYLVFAILWSFVILGILKNERISNALSSCKFLKFVGEISFEMYLLHYLIMWKVTQYTTDTLVVAIVVSVVSLVFAVAVNKVSNKVVII